MSPDELRTAGFNDQEISDHLKGAGFSGPEIQEWMGAPPAVSPKTNPYNITPVKDHFSIDRAKQVLSDTVQGAKDPQTWKGTGGAIGSAVGVAAGIPLGLPGIVGGGMVGGAGGEAIEQVIMRVLGQGGPETSEEAMRKINEQAAWGGGSEMLPPMVGNALKPLGEIPEQAARMAKIAKGNKLPLSPSAILPSKTAKAFEWVGDVLPTGKAWTTHKRKQLSEALVKMTDDTIGSISTGADKYEAGVKLSEGTRLGKGKLATETQKQYRGFSDYLKTIEAGGNNLDNTVETLTKHLDEFKEGTPAHDTFSMIIDRAKRGQVGGDQIDILQKSIWDATYPKKSYIGGEIWESLKKDLADTPDALLLLERAKEANKLKAAFDKNTTVKNILRFGKQDPEKVILTAFRSGNIEEVKAIKKAVDKETWDMARSRFVENLLDTAITEKGTQRILEPQKFNKIFKTYERQIKSVFPEIYDNIKQLDDVFRASVDDLSKGSMGDWQKGWQGAAAAGMLAGAYKSPGIVIPAGVGTWAISKSLMNPKGWLKAFLTGAAAEPVKQGLRMGGRAAMMKSHD